MDYSKLSDKDLEAISKNNWAGVSDEGLHLIASQSPGMSEENPAPVDMFPERDSDRILVGYGDEKHPAEAAARQGYSKGHLNADGDLIAMDKKGRYVKDATNFFPNQGNKTPVTSPSTLLQAAKEVLGSAHPLNWLEANSGPAWKNAGMVTGGGLAGALGTALSVGNAGIGAISGIGGATAGSALGERARQAIGRYYGVDRTKPGDPESDAALLNAGTLGMGAEVSGRAAGAIPLPGGMKNVEALTNKIASKILAAPSWAMQGGAVPYGDVARNLEFPQGVSAAGDRGFGLRTAQKTEAELNANMKKVYRDSAAAQDKFRMDFGNRKADKTSALDNGLNFLRRPDIAPDAVGQSRVPVEERNSFLDELVNLDKGDPGTMLTQAKKLQDEVAHRKSVSQQFSGPVEGATARLAGDIKASLHKLDPEGLGASDAETSRAIGHATALRPVEGENQEGVINSIWNENNTARQEAAKELAPNTYETELKDLKSRQAYKRAGAMGETSKEQALRGAVATLLGAGPALANHSGPEAIAAASAALAAMSPKLHYYGGQAVGRSLPRLLPEAAYQAEQKFMPNPWTLLKRKDESQ